MLGLMCIQHVDLQTGSAWTLLASGCWSETETSRAAFTAQAVSVVSLLRAEPVGSGPYKAVALRGRKAASWRHPAPEARKDRSTAEPAEGARRELSKCTMGGGAMAGLSRGTNE